MYHGYRACTYMYALGYLLQCTHTVPTLCGLSFASSSHSITWLTINWTVYILYVEHTTRSIDGSSYYSSHAAFKVVSQSLSLNVLFSQVSWYTHVQWPRLPTLRSWKHVCRTMHKWPKLTATIMQEGCMYLPLLQSYILWALGIRLP